VPIHRTVSLSLVISQIQLSSDTAHDCCHQTASLPTSLIIPNKPPKPPPNTPIPQRPRPQRTRPPPNRPRLQNNPGMVLCTPPIPFTSPALPLYTQSQLTHLLFPQKMRSTDWFQEFQKNIKPLWVKPRTSFCLSPCLDQDDPS
jgi:hypothetical protein